MSSWSGMDKATESSYSVGQPFPEQAGLKPGVWFTALWAALSKHMPQMMRWRK